MTTTLSATSRAAALVSAVLLFAEPVKADEDIGTGNYIIAGCKVFAEDTESAFNQADVIIRQKAFECIGAISGVLEIAVLNHHICAPSEVTVGQLTKVVSR